MERLKYVIQFVDLDQLVNKMVKAFESSKQCVANKYEVKSKLIKQIESQERVYPSTYSQHLNSPFCACSSSLS